MWSRFLYGGRSVLGLSVSATLIGVGLGLVIGLTAAYAGGAADEVLMRGADVFLAFPQIVLALLLVSAFGPKLWLIVLTVGISHAPRVARVIRGAAQQVVERDFVKAAEAVGEPRMRIIFGELLPNVTSPLLPAPPDAVTVRDLRIELVSHRAGDHRLLATGEHLLLHVDRDAGRTAAAAPEVLAALRRIAADQQELARPQAAGARIDGRRTSAS